MAKKEHYLEAEKYRQLAGESAKENDNIGKVFYSGKAGEEFEKAGNYKRAAQEYGHALQILESLGKPFPQYGEISKKYGDAQKNRLLKIGKYIQRREDRTQGGLEAAAVTASVISILGGIFFLSSNVTGNVIGNFSQNSGNIIGAILLTVGVVAGFFWVKKK
jgi:hypothetical protein